MIKYTQKQLKEMIKDGIVEDITHFTNKQILEIKNSEEWLNKIGLCQGIYGCNGMLLKGEKSGKLYAITSRTTTLYSI